MSIPLQSRGFRSGAAQSRCRSKSLEPRPPLPSQVHANENDLSQLLPARMISKRCFDHAVPCVGPIPSISLSSCSWWLDFGPATTATAVKLREVYCGSRNYNGVVCESSASLWHHYRQRLHP